MVTRRQPQRAKAEVLGEVVPHPDVGAGLRGSSGNLAENPTDAERDRRHLGSIALVGFDHHAPAALFIRDDAAPFLTNIVGRDHRTDEGNITDGIGGLLEHGFVTEDVIHHASTARHRLIIQIIPRQKMHTLFEH